MSDGSPEVHYLPDLGAATACGKIAPGLHLRESWDGVTCAGCILTRPRETHDPLLTAVAALQRTVDGVEADLLARYAQQPAAAHPDLVRDTTGRYILLDARAALVNGYAALNAAH